MTSINLVQAANSRILSEAALAPPLFLLFSDTSKAFFFISSFPMTFRRLEANSSACASGAPLRFPNAPIPRYSALISNSKKRERR